MKTIKRFMALVLLAALLSTSGVMPGYAEEVDPPAEVLTAETAQGEATAETPAETDAEVETTEPTAPQETDISLAGVKDVADYKYQFETVCENSQATLLIDKSVNNLRVVSKATGAYYDTKVMNGQSGNDFIRSWQKSDFVLNYYKEEIKGSTVTMDAYTQSIAFEQVDYTPLSDGIRCDFTVGDSERLHVALFPMYISMERLEEHVLQYLTDKERATFLKDFYTETRTRVIRKWNTLQKDGKPANVPIARLRSLYDYFYQRGTYTAEELAYDNAEWGEETIDASIMFDVSMEYRLEGSDLVVSVTRIEGDEKYSVSDITINPYLMSSDLFDEGYLFVPEGCGGIIDFNTGNTLRPVVSIPVYGKDPLIAPYLYTEDFTQATLPVAGIKKNDMALLCIIEEGASIATISANIAGKMDEFNKISINFNTTYMERIFLTYGRGEMIPKYLNESYKGNITMRYRMLEGEDASYTGMAKAYQDYLKTHGKLKSNPVPDSALLFVDMVATALQKKMFLGFTVTDFLPTTTTADAIGILDSLKANGVNNTVVEYRDFMNNGIENTSLTQAKIIKSIGGAKGVNSLLDYAAANEIDLFASIRLNTIFNIKGLPKKNDALSRYIDNNIAERLKLDLMSRTTFNTGGSSFILSPDYIRDIYAPAANKSMGKLGFNGLALNDSGTLLYGTYGRKKQYMRTEGADLFTEAFNSLAADFNLLYANPNAYALASASYITDIPVKRGSRRAVDHEVPFVQMVLENEVPYSMPAYNADTMQWNGFDEYFLKAVETKGHLKLILTKADEVLFSNSLINPNNNTQTYFMTRYDRWEDKIGAYYRDYDAFYQQVKEAEIISHTYINATLVKVAYSNGLTVYVNYGSKPVTVDGVSIDSVSYAVSGR